jgi:hypothetical protein
MKRAAAIAAILLGASSAGAQCLGDFNNDGMVEINELVVSVNNALNSCAGSPTPTVPPGGQCPIDLSDDNTQPGTQDCYYIGRWNQSCGAADQEARWISDGIEDDGEPDIVVVDLLGFDPNFLFLAAEVTSPTSGELFAWFTVLNPGVDDLHDTSGSLTLGDSGGTLVVEPDQAPFRINGCDFARYEGTLTDVVTPSSVRRAAPAQVSPALLERLHSLRAAQRARVNFHRK